MSALLTTTMPYMKVVIKALNERGIRDDYIVLVGGAPLNEEFGRAIGADAYCRDAAVAAETARRLVDGVVPLPEAPHRRPRPPTAIRAGALGASSPRWSEPVGSPAGPHPGIDVTCLPAEPPQPARADRRPPSTARSGARGPPTRPIFVAYADCGTGGRLDAVLGRPRHRAPPRRALLRVLRRVGAFEALADEEPGTFYLTDFLARNFERLVIGGLGSTATRSCSRPTSPTTGGSSTSPRPRSRRPSPLARAAADRLGLAFQHHPTGFGGLGRDRRPPGDRRRGRLAVGRRRRPRSAGPGAEPGRPASEDRLTCPPR